jgi:hypothetical protein
MSDSPSPVYVPQLPICIPTVTYSGTDTILTGITSNQYVRVDLLIATINFGAADVAAACVVNFVDTAGHNGFMLAASQGQGSLTGLPPNFVTQYTQVPFYIPGGELVCSMYSQSGANSSVGSVQLFWSLATLTDTSWP